MLIKLGQKIINLEGIRTLETKLEKTGRVVNEIIYHSGASENIYSDALAWAVSTFGVLPIPDLEVGYANREKIEANLAAKNASQQAETQPQTAGLAIPLPPSVRPQSANPEPKDPQIAELEDQLRNIDVVLQDAAQDPTGLDPMHLAKARARRNQLAEIISQAKKVQ